MIDNSATTTTTAAPRNVILQGDALALLGTLPDGYVQACITSPPYWNLRDYHLPKTAWPAVSYQPMAGLPPLTIDPMECCLGLEPTLEAYVGHVVAIFRDVHRVLRDDGVCWLNLGDSYASHAKGGDGPGATGLTYGGAAYQEEASEFRRRNNARDAGRIGLKFKDLCMLPHRVAMALQADGWWVRNDCVWSKANPMPDSTVDRCSRSHEYVFHLAKSRRYFFDAAAIREAIRPKTLTTYGTTREPLGNDALGQVKADNWSRSMPMRVPTGWDTGPGAHGAYHREGRAKTDKQRGHSRRHAGFNDRWDAMDKAEQMANGRNKRSVWTISSGRGFEGSHYATFPPELAEVCIASASRVGDLVLDPFMGSGTVALVCQQLGRDYLGLELSPDYVAMAERRLGRTQQPMLLYTPRRSAAIEQLEELEEREHSNYHGQEDDHDHDDESRHRGLGATADDAADTGTAV